MDHLCYYDRVPEWWSIVKCEYDRASDHWCAEIKNGAKRIISTGFNGADAIDNCVRRIKEYKD